MDIFGTEISWLLIVGIILGLVAVAAFLLSVTRKKPATVEKKDWRTILLIFGIVYFVLYLGRNLIDRYIGVSIPAPGWVIMLALVTALVILVYKILGKEGWKFEAKEIAMMVFAGVLVISAMILLPTYMPDLFSVKAIPEIQQAVITTTQSVMSVVGLG